MRYGAVDDYRTGWHVSGTGVCGTSIVPPFVTKLVEEVGRIRHGRHVEDDIGHLTTDLQVNIARDHLADALARGAVLESTG